MGDCFFQKFRATWWLKLPDVTNFWTLQCIFGGRRALASGKRAFQVLLEN